MSGSERRRLARIPLRCAVVVRERLATWAAETADVGARGCRITLTRPVVQGALLQLRFERGDGAAAFEAVGQVVWTRKGEPLEAGVAFVSAPRAGGEATSWIDALAVAQVRRAVREGASALEQLRDAVLRLGTPPGGPLSAAALAVARIAEREGRISEVPGGREGLEALAELLADGTLTLGAARRDAQGWARAFSLPPGAGPPRRAPAAPAARAIAPPPPPIPPLAVVRPLEADAGAAPAPRQDPGASRVAEMIAESLLDGEDEADAGGARVA